MHHYSQARDVQEDRDFITAWLFLAAAARSCAPLSFRASSAGRVSPTENRRGLRPASVVALRPALPSAKRKRPIRQPSRSAAKCVAQNELGEDADAGTRDQGRHHRLTIIHAQRTRRSHARGFAVLDEAPRLGRHRMAVADAAVLREADRSQCKGDDASKRHAGGGGFRGWRGKNRRGRRRGRHHGPAPQAFAGGPQRAGHPTRRWKLREHGDHYSRARRQAPGLTPTMPVNTRVRWL